MASTDEIRIATWADEADVAAVITLAFCADPMVGWIFPNPKRRIETFLRLVGMYGGRAFDHGSAYVVGDFAGAALWLPPGVGPDEGPMTRLLEKTIGEPVRSTYFSLFEKTAAHHPKEPHWYLPLIGVDPACRGKGHGSALMARALAVCDRDRKPAYLESTNPANLSLYERHGFRVLAEVRVGDSPARYPMLREPR